MVKTANQPKPTKKIPKKAEKPPHSWSAMKAFFVFKHTQLQDQIQSKERPEQQKEKPKLSRTNLNQNQKQKDKQVRREELSQQQRRHNGNERERHRQKQREKQKQERKEEQPQRKLKQEEHTTELEALSKKCKKMKCSGSLCSNTKVMHRPETSSLSPVLKQKAQRNSSGDAFSSSDRSMKPLVTGPSSFSLSTSSSNSSSLRGMPFSRFYGCYECRMVIDPVLGITRDASLRSNICSCPDCNEIFMNSENLELHRAVQHAVSELGPEDTSKNIVEIIFKSSWLKKQSPICQIQRILKVQHSQKTLTKFEEYRDSIKAKYSAAGKHQYPRCVADGNELLRFHSTTASCPLGIHGSTALCAAPGCHACRIIKNGFKIDQETGKTGILTTATSGRAHDKAAEPHEGRQGEARAMLVCRVIAGRVKKKKKRRNGEEGGEEEEEEGGGILGEDYDSLGGDGGVYSNLDELWVFDPKAILPCFVVIYSL